MNDSECVEGKNWSLKYIGPNTKMSNNVCYEYIRVLDHILWIQSYGLLDLWIIYYSSERCCDPRNMNLGLKRGNA